MSRMDDYCYDAGCTKRLTQYYTDSLLKEFYVVYKTQYT